MTSVLKKPFSFIVFVVSSSVITALLIAYKWLSGVFNVKDLGIIIAMGAVLVFMVFMILNLRTIKRPERYMLEVYNTLGEKDDVNFRREFTNYDVASSYMLMYRKMYPMYRFVLVSDSEHAKKTVHRYLE
jgi:hypothetical protein